MHQKLKIAIVDEEQVLHKTVGESILGLADEEVATLRAANAMDRVEECAGESFSSLDELFKSLDGGEGGSIETSVAPLVVTSI